MNILLPNNPLEPREVDPAFADQAAAAAAAGFSVHLVSFEALVQEKSPSRAVRRVPEGAGACLYRGWMLKPSNYRTLADALEVRGAPLAIAPDAYEYAHHLPCWYGDFEGVTAATAWTRSADIEHARAALRQLPDGAAIVKDYVKSAKHRWNDACYIPNVRDEATALTVVTAFVTDQGADLNGGLVLRAFRPYLQSGRDPVTGMPVIEERRLFLWHGNPLHLVGDESALLRNQDLQVAVSRLKSPFVSLDLARIEGDRWEVVEVGDGQVSGLRDIAVQRFFLVLREAVCAST